jgi:polyhydroxybutyrate depolymerase
MIDPAFLSCDPVHPTPAMQIHGTADPTVPYNGSTGVLGAFESAEYWVAFNNCNPTPVETAVPDVDMTDMCTADHFVYSGGDAGSSVEFYRVNGGAHTWPGTNPFFSTLGVTNQDFSASVEIWRFFSQYRLNELVGIENGESADGFNVFPNPSNGEMNIRFDNAMDRTIQVQNSLGQTIQEFNSYSKNFSLSLNGSGMFLLTVISEKGIFSRKLIVE